MNATEVTRNNIIKLVRSLTIEQINKIPTGYANNIAWNLGHVIITQQLLTYKLSNLEMHTSDVLVDEFRKGSKPSKTYTSSDIDDLIHLSKVCLDKTAYDFENNTFQEYTTYPTSYGIELNSAKEAFEFNAVHEALHLGYIMAMKKLV